MIEHVAIIGGGFSGSLAAIIELIAQMGFRSAKVRSITQSNVEATRTFAAKCMPTQSSLMVRTSHCFARLVTVRSG